MVVETSKLDSLLIPGDWQGVAAEGNGWQAGLGWEMTGVTVDRPVTWKHCALQEMQNMYLDFPVVILD